VRNDSDYKENKLCKFVLLVGLLVTLLSKSLTVFAEIKGSVEFELAYAVEPQNLSKVESLIQFEFDGNLTNDIRYTLIPRLRLDFDDHLNTEDNRASNYSNINGPITDSNNSVLELAEAYIDFDAIGGSWTVGKQQVVWGEADGLKVLDLINPQDFRELNLERFEDSRIATWLINGEFEIGFLEESTVQILLIPDMTFNRLADNGADFSITSPLYAPQPNPAIPTTIKSVDRPSGEIEVGVRWEAFVNGWELSLNYFDHFNDTPVIFRELNDNGVLVSPQYLSNEVYGVSANNAFGDWVLRLEVAVNSDSYLLSNNLTTGRGIINSPEVKSVIGLDYYGFADTLLSYQWFHSSISDYDDEILRDKDNSIHTLTLRREFRNQTLRVQLFALLDEENDDGEVRAEVFYRYSDKLDVWLGFDGFYGDSLGLYGQFDSNDRITTGLKYSF